MSTDPNTIRKIIHVDMDCFYAAIEMRDNPSLANKPVAVGGASERRGVLCTCNYLARKHGVHSAMPTAIAYRYCPDLIVLPVNMPKYRHVSKNINAIFSQFTALVEPLSLDEAFLDVTHCPLYKGSATWIAEAIRSEIWQAERITASAGVAPNKFLAKIASAWRKPNGLFVIRPEQVLDFVNPLPVTKLFGVGKVTAEKLHNMNINTGAELQQVPLRLLIQHFGKLGEHLYYQCRGIDNRAVQPNRIRKSLSVETTLAEDIHEASKALELIDELFIKLSKRLAESGSQSLVKNQYLKIKFSDFQLMTCEIKCTAPDLQQFHDLFDKAYKEQKPVRLIGLGVHFYASDEPVSFIQHSLF